MKRTLFYTSLGAALLASCSSEPAVPALPALPATPAAAPQHAAPAPRYVALPGQAAVAVNSDVDAAFDQQVAAYAGQSPSAPAASSLDITAPVPPVAPAADVTAPAAPDAPAPADVTAPAVPAPTADAAPAPTAAAAPAPTADVTAAPTGGSMNYKVRITNDTPGRVFVEAQDAAGTIYPCGFMEGGRTFTTPMENAAPIKGPITVVVRDPDQPGAPEIRRYKVDPPTSSYDGKSVGVNILSGGRYMASVDGQVYYCTPAPEEPTPQPNQPAAPAAPEAPAPAAPEAPAPAAPAAPAPAPAPAA